ncbi:hypothetical protein [Pedobacter immunditicola]|uniref:hypothetical protein n=1 Tax=Pedobacter immunditicola TaxID=3133440 RepID=UPI0030A5CF8D
MKKHFSIEVITFMSVLLPLCFVLVFLDYVMGSGLEYFYHRQRSGTLYRTNYTMDSTRAEVLVVGSSRASHHYDAFSMAGQLGKTVYNGGRDGQGLIYSAAVISAATHRYKPEVIIIDILPDEFFFNEKDRLTALFPYYGKPYIRPYIDYAGDFEKYKLLSKVYPYNSLLPSIVAGNVYLERSEKDYLGFIPLEGMMSKNSIIKLRSGAQLMDMEKLALFKNLLVDMENQKIVCFIVISPLYKELVPDATINTCKSITSNFKYIKFLNFAKPDQYNDHTLFRDANHLNAKGAERFTTDVVDSLSVYL